MLTCPSSSFEVICTEIIASPNESPFVVGTTDPILTDKMGSIVPTTNGDSLGEVVIYVQINFKKFKKGYVSMKKCLSLWPKSEFIRVQSDPVETTLYNFYIPILSLL